MVEYYCDRCGYITNHKPNFRNHLNRKNICLVTNTDVSIDYIKEKYGLHIKNVSKNSKIPPKTSNISQKISKIYPTNYEIQPIDSSIIVEKRDNDKINNSKLLYICKYCDKSFSKKWNLNRHISCCKKNLEKIEKQNLIQENEKLKLLVQDLEHDNKTLVTNIQINNSEYSYNQINSNNSIIINNYGKEDLSYLTHDEMTNYVKNLPPGVLKFIEKIHFNPKHPENTNLRITNKKDSLIQIRKKNKWIFENKSDVIRNLLSDKYQLLEAHLAELDKTEISLKDNRVIDRFRNNYEENVKYMKNLLKRIELLILNNSN